MMFPLMLLSQHTNQNVFWCQNWSSYLCFFPPHLFQVFIPKSALATWIRSYIQTNSAWKIDSEMVLEFKARSPLEVSSTKILQLSTTKKNGLWEIMCNHKGKIFMIGKASSPNTSDLILWRCDVHQHLKLRVSISIMWSTNTVPYLDHAVY